MATSRTSRTTGRTTTGRTTTGRTTTGRTTTGRTTTGVAKAAGPGPKRTKRLADPRPPRDPKPVVEGVARALSGKAARYLRGLGHHLVPVVQIGKEGLTDGLVAATREALLAHELVKVRVSAEAPVDRKSAGQELADRTGAALAQTLGRTLLLYKRHPNKPVIALPR